MYVQDGRRREKLCGPCRNAFALAHCAIRKHRQSLIDLRELKSMAQVFTLEICQPRHEGIEEHITVKESVSITPRREVSRPSGVVRLRRDENPMVARVQLDWARVRKRSEIYRYDLRMIYLRVTNYGCPAGGDNPQTQSINYSMKV